MRHKKLVFTFTSKVKFTSLDFGYYNLCIVIEEEVISSINDQKTRLRKILKLKIKDSFINSTIQQKRLFRWHC